MYKKKVLDHGYVKLRNLAGPTRRLDASFDADDTDVAQAARMSFEQSGSERTYDQEMKLTKYLMVNEHSSPFEMIECWFEMKVPIFVDRQFVRHRTMSRSESSGRYITLPEDWYIPDLADVMMASKDKKQGGRLINLQDEDERLLGQVFVSTLSKACQESYRAYEDAIEAGIAPEQARMLLHVNHYVHYLAKVDLRNLFHFFKLRCHEHAQRESRLYAEAMLELIQPHLPGLTDLFNEEMRL